MALFEIKKGQQSLFRGPNRRARDNEEWGSEDASGGNVIEMTDHENVYANIEADRKKTMKVLRGSRAQREK